MVPLMSYFRDVLKVSVIGYEYIGYNHTKQTVAPCSQICFEAPSESESIPHTQITPSESKCYESINAVYKYIVDRLKVPEQQQVWMGISIGTGPTVALVSSLCKGSNLAKGSSLAKGSGPSMILVSPFYSATSVVSHFLSRIYDVFPSYDKMKSVTAPTLILHGSNDEVIPVDHSVRLSSCHKKERNCRLHIIKGAGHNDIIQCQEALTHIYMFLHG